ncbi:MAG: cytochrome c [Deltaproteobacteria bacterium]|nr:cytochrome c [Deltaproteobacteria bacterium]
MRKKCVLIFFTILFTFCFLGLSIAGEKKGNARKGKYLFRKSCRACHNGSKAAELGPFNKKISEWKSAFSPGKYKEFKCSSEWEKLSEQDLKDMLLYLRDGAADSTVPRGCG